MNRVGLRLARAAGLIASLGLIGTGLVRYWWYRMEPLRGDGIHFPWAEAFPFLIVGSIVLSLSILLWTYSPSSSSAERGMWILAAIFLAGIATWGLRTLRSNDVVEGVQFGTEGPGVTVAPALVDDTGLEP